MKLEKSAQLEETAVAMERFGKHVPAATDTYVYAAIEELLQALFSVRSASRGRQLGT
jgi:hypothetical protein